MADSHTNGNTNGSKMLVAFLTATTILSGAAALVTPVYFLTASHEEQMEEMSADAKDLEFYRGQVTEKLRSLQEQVDKALQAIATQDTNLQREMRDVNAVTDAKLQGLDARLQNENQTTSQLLQNEIAASREAVERQHEQQIENQVNIARLQQQIKELINSLERGK